MEQVRAILLSRVISITQSMQRGRAAHGTLEARVLSKCMSVRNLQTNRRLTAQHPYAKLPHRLSHAWQHALVGPEMRCRAKFAEPQAGDILCVQSITVPFSSVLYITVSGDLTLSLYLHSHKRLERTWPWTGQSQAQGAMQCCTTSACASRTVRCC